MSLLPVIKISTSSNKNSPFDKRFTEGFDRTSLLEILQQPQQQEQEPETRPA